MQTSKKATNKNSKIIKHLLKDKEINFLYEQQKYVCFDVEKMTIFGYQSASSFSNYNVKFVHSPSEFVRTISDSSFLEVQQSYIVLNVKQLSALRVKHNHDKL